MTTRALLLGALLTLTGCPADTPLDGAEEGSGAGSTGSGLPTTGPPAETTDDATTGPPGSCEPAVTELPEAEFVKTFVDTICAQKEACGCPSATCSFGFTDDLEAIVAAAKMQGMVYDEACAIQTLTAYVTSRGCLDGTQANYPFCEYCSAYRGTTEVGEMCMTTFEPNLYLFGEPCAGDAICFDPTCEVPDISTIPAGGVCGADDEFNYGSCEDGTLCDVFDSYLCEPILPDGADCTVKDGVCGYDSFCTPLGVCEPYRGEGEPCGSDYDCTSVYCVDKQCVEYTWVCEFTDLDNGIFGPPH